MILNTGGFQMNNKEEIWKNLKISGYEHFIVSNFGRVKNTKTDHLMTPCDNGNGYLCYRLKNNGKIIYKYAHRLVAELFLDSWDEKLQVNHIDEDKYNNYVDNLEMVTDSQNKKHSKKFYVNGHLISQGKILQVFDLNDNFLFESVGLWETCRKYNFDPRSVQRVINGKYKSYKGYKFKYKDKIICELDGKK